MTLHALPRPLLYTALALALACMGALPFFVGEYFLGIAFTLVMFVALTQSWVVLSGMSGYVSLGHVVFFGSGAYVFALTWGIVPIWAGVLLAGVSVGAVALVFGYPVLRVRGPYFVIMSFGLAELVKNLVLINEARNFVSMRPLFGAPPLKSLYLAMFVLAVAATCITFWLRRSRFGYGLRCIREDETAAEAIGIPVARLKVFAFALSAFIPAMAGALYIMRTGLFQPIEAFNPVISFAMVTMAIIGGSDDAPGPLVGVLFLVILQELLWVNWPELYMIVLGLFLIVFVLFVPKGIYGWLAPERSKRADAA